MALNIPICYFICSIYLDFWLGWKYAGRPLAWQLCHAKCGTQQGRYAPKAENMLLLMCGCVCTCLQDPCKIVPIWKELSGGFGCALNSVVQCSGFSLAKSIVIFVPKFPTPAIKKNIYIFLECLLQHNENHSCRYRKINVFNLLWTFRYHSICMY